MVKKPLNQLLATLYYTPHSSAQRTWNSFNLKRKILLTKRNSENTGGGAVVKWQNRKILSSPYTTDTKPTTVSTATDSENLKTGRRDLPQLVTERRPYQKG